MSIAGLQGNEMAQPRVFAHDAKIVYEDVTIPGTETRGCCLYIGEVTSGATATDITVVMESGQQAVFSKVPHGSFLPILVTKVVSVDGGDIGKVLALF